MYYIKKDGTNHGNPISVAFSDSVALPERLLSAYIETKGFCTLTVEDCIVTALEVNQEALDSYNESHPETEAPEDPVTLESLKAENEQLKAQQEVLENCILEIADIVYA